MGWNEQHLGTMIQWSVRKMARLRAPNLLNDHATGAKMAECVNSVQRALKRMCLDEEIDKR